MCGGYPTVGELKTDRERASRREVALAIIFFLPIWCVRLAAIYDPFARKVIGLFDPLWFVGVLCVCYALSTGFALSTYRNGEYSGRSLGAIMLAAIQFGSIGLVVAAITPRFQ
jgi:hypothetical protein